jgi:NAD-dependent DNA ligase
MMGAVDQSVVLSAASPRAISPFGEGDMSYARIIGADHNRLVQGCGSLLGIAAGLLADNQLNNAEINFLKQWLEGNEAIRTQWPGDILYERIRDVLSDGVITEKERDYLIVTLQKICGGTLDLGPQAGVNQMAFDEEAHLEFPRMNYCVTGDFVYGPRERVCEAIESRGGFVLKGITKKLNYLVVGLRGSEEWKHGSYGTKILKAVEYKRAGLPMLIVSEDTWSSALRAAC